MNNIKKIEELEEYEKIVQQIEFPFFIPAFHKNNLDIKNQVRKDVLYYLKLGLSLDDLKVKLEIKKNKLKPLIYAWKNPS
jgi:hypothetical protein